MAGFKIIKVNSEAGLKRAKKAKKGLVPIAFVWHCIFRNPVDHVKLTSPTSPEVRGNSVINLSFPYLRTCTRRWRERR